MPTPVPTVDEVIRYLATLGATLDPDADPTLALAAAIQAAWQDTGVEFGSTPATRSYNGRGDFYLPIDACSDITAVNLVGPFWGGDPDWVGSPVPVEVWDAAPANTVTKNALVYLWGRWPMGYANVQVTATFGAAMPPDLYQAVIHRTAGTLLPLCGSTGAAVLAGPPTEIKEGEIGVKWGGGGASGSGGGYLGAAQTEYERAVARYRVYAL